MDRDESSVPSLRAVSPCAKVDNAIFTCSSYLMLFHSIFALRSLDIRRSMQVILRRKFLSSGYVIFSIQFGSFRLILSDSLCACVSQRRLSRVHIDQACVLSPSMNS